MITLVKPLAAAGAAVLLLSGCSPSGSAKHAAGATSSAASSSTARATTIPSTSTPRPEPTGKEACAMLASNRDLTSAMGFYIVSGVVRPGDVTETVNDLVTARNTTPPEFATSLDNIIDVLTKIDDSAKTGGADAIDGSTLEADANLIAGMCRSRGFVVPPTSPR